MSEEVFPGPLREFVRLFNREDFWESHEVLEAPWRRGDSSFYHGLILYASAFVHLRRANPHGVRAQLAKTLDALDGLPDAYLGIDVAAIREHARSLREAVGDDEDPPEGWTQDVSVPRLRLDPARVRGDELEAARPDRR